MGGLIIGFVLGAAPAVARELQARLVHCGDTTCVRISGHRSSPAVTVKIGTRTLPVEGGRGWHAVVPLATARTWPTRFGYELALTLVDRQAGTEKTDLVMLPPGALGRGVELAELTVRAH